MGTLAFDRDRLAVLGTALGDAAERLAAAHCDDPEAAAALAVAAAARAAYDAWAATLVQITGCSVLDGYQPVSIDTSQLALALDHVLSAGYGWAIANDPAGVDWHTPLTMQAAALGLVLTNYGAPLGTAADELQLLTELQAVLADPDALAALRANLTPAGVAALATQLAEHRADLVADGGGPPGTAVHPSAELADRVAMVDEIAAALATALVDPGAPLADAQAALDQMHPVAAALLIGQLDAPDDVVVPLAKEVMARYDDEGKEPGLPEWWQKPDFTSLGIGDLLFPRVAECAPQAAHDFVAYLGQIDEELLTATVRHPPSIGALMVTATDPAAIGAAGAQAVLVPFVELLRDPPEVSDVPSSVFTVGYASEAIRSEMGKILAPWLLTLGAEEGAFGWTDEQRDDVLRWVIADDQAFADLSAAVPDSTFASLPDPHGDPQALRDNLALVGDAIGQLTGLIEERRSGTAQAEQAAWDTVMGMLPKAIGKGLGYAGVSGVPAKAAAKVVVVGVDELSGAAQRHGWLGAPPPLDDVLGGIRFDSDQAMVVGAYLGMVAMRALLVDRGDLPADTSEVPAPWDGSGCPSSDYVALTDDWLRSEVPASAGDEIELARAQFIAGGQSALECQRLQT